MLKSPRSPDPQAAGAKKVLVVGDGDRDCATRLACELPYDRFQLTIAAGADQAMQIAAGADYDMALVEIDTPRRASSLSVLRSLLSRMPGTPVIMFTDFGDDELWVDAMNEGASDLLHIRDLRRELERY